MKFVCLGYLDEETWNGFSEEKRQSCIKECVEYDDQLRAGGHFAGGQCLDSATLAKTLSHRDGKVVVTDGPFAETKEILGGILYLEAANLEQAVALMKPHPGVKMGPFEIRPAKSETESAEAEIRELIARWSRALEAKDVEAMMADYLPDAVLFDAIPPYKTVGREAIKAAWEQCLPYFPDKFRSEHSDLVVSVEGNLAFVHGVHHFVPEPPDHPCGQTWMRISVGYRKVGGAWKVAHEHVSVPFNPMTNQIWGIKDPAILDMPDYKATSQPCGAAKE